MNGALQRLLIPALDVFRDEQVGRDIAGGMGVPAELREVTVAVRGELGGRVKRGENQVITASLRSGLNSRFSGSPARHLPRRLFELCFQLLFFPPASILLRLMLMLLYRLTLMLTLAWPRPQ